MNKYLIIVVCALITQTAFSCENGKILKITVNQISALEDFQQTEYLHSTQTIDDLTRRLSKDHPVSVGVRTFQNDHWRYEGLVDTQQTLADVLHKYPRGEFYSICRKTQVQEFSIGTEDGL